mgnify:CR=1 FL=1
MLIMKKFVLFKWVFIISVILTAVKCTKNQTDYGIPLVYVERQLNVNNPSFFNLSVVGGWEYVVGGSRGILVYRSGPSQFNAYDRHSTYEIDNNCRVEVDSTNIAVVDPCSGSRWSIIDGSILEGPAVLPLKPYATRFDGTFLYISN